MELFWRRGYEGTSLAELTAAMGISPPSLYAAFGDKAKLFRAAVARYSDLSGGAPGPLETERSARLAVAGLLRGAAEAFTRKDRPRGCMVIAAAGKCASDPAADADPIEAEMRGQRRGNEANLARRLVRAIDEGELPASTDVLALAKFYAAVIQGMSIQARDGATTGELTKVVELAMAAWPAGPAPASAASGRAKRARSRARP